MGNLIVAEHDNSGLKPATPNTVAAARVIGSGGRGMQSSEHFRLLEDIADLFVALPELAAELDEL